MIQKALVFFAFIWAFTGYAQSGNTWSKRADFGGLKREKAVAFSIDQYGYVATGTDTAEATHNDLWQYNPSTDTWTQLASIPGVARRSAVAFTAGGKGYVGTGFTHDDTDFGEKLKDFWEYDPLDNTWLNIADYPGGGDTGIYQATAFSVLGKGYVACGKIGSDAYIPELWEYTPETDSWLQKTPFPGGDRHQLISFVLENKAYVGLGTDHDVFRKDLWEYDALTNTWEPAPDFPGTERAQSTAFTIGAKGFVVFGTDGGLKEELWEYHFYTKSWSIRSPFPGGGRKHGVAFSIADTGYVGLGKETSGKKQSFYAYFPTGPLGIEESNEVQINLYPNPFTEYINVQTPEVEDLSYTILNIDGRCTAQGIIQHTNTLIPTEGWANGIYIISIQQNDRILFTKKIQKQ